MKLYRTFVTPWPGQTQTVYIVATSAKHAQAIRKARLPGTTGHVLRYFGLCVARWPAGTIIRERATREPDL